MADDATIGRPETVSVQWPLSPWVRPWAAPPAMLSKAAAIMRNDRSCIRWRTLEQVWKADTDVVVAWFETRAQMAEHVTNVFGRAISMTNTAGYTCVQRRRKVNRPRGEPPWEKIEIVRNRHGKVGRYWVNVVIYPDTEKDKVDMLDVMDTLAHELLHVCAVHEKYQNRQFEVVDREEHETLSGLPGRSEDVWDEEHLGLTTSLNRSTLETEWDERDRVNPAFKANCNMFHEAAIRQLGLWDRYKPAGRRRR